MAISMGHEIASALTCLAMTEGRRHCGEPKQSHQATLLNLIGREWAGSHNVRNLTCTLIAAIITEKGKEVRHGKDASLVMPLGVS